jgi:hypothetical protein
LISTSSRFGRRQTLINSPPECLLSDLLFLACNRRRARTKSRITRPTKLFVNRLFSACCSFGGRQTLINGLPEGLLSDLLFFASSRRRARTKSRIAWSTKLFAYCLFSARCSFCR